MNWFRVDDITSLTYEKEKLTQAASKELKVNHNARPQRRAHRRQYHIPMTKEDYTKCIEDQGYEITYDPPGYGSCQSEALRHQLETLGVLRSVDILREEVVKYLSSHPVSNDGTPMLEYVSEFENWEVLAWEDYVKYMAQTNTYGDQRTIAAAANLYTVNIQVISTLGPGGSHLFRPSLTEVFTTVFFGHFAENHGEHYVGLKPLSTEIHPSSDEIDETLDQDGQPG